MQLAQRYVEKVALVTGGGSGLGEVCTRRFAAEGAKVAVLDVDAVNGERVAAELRAGGAEAVFLQCDVTDAAGTQSTIDAVVKRFGRLDVALNNAGIAGILLPLTDYPPATWERVLAINLSGVFHCMRAQIPHMVRQGGGAIVNMASLLGTVGFAATAAYTAAKHGVVGLTKIAALEYGPAGVRVNAVGPSFIRTPLTTGALPEEAWAGLAASHPLKRCAEPAEIAGMVAFLGSDEASYVTGSLHLVDGGYAAG
jgi:NAD(P)-dependent dehydrogenase (short-subunit alcohol dehydrogenase family)